MFGDDDDVAGGDDDDDDGVGDVDEEVGKSVVGSKCAEDEKVEDKSSSRLVG